MTPRASGALAPFYSDDHLTLYGGDCREILRELPAESVHCVVTSPPYWGLRDYGTASWDGGDPECDHKAPAPTDADMKAKGKERGYAPGSNFANYADGFASAAYYRETCGKCGARRIDSQLGLEATPEEFVANMVDVFREVRRVLRKDGTLWLNLGDSYAASGGDDRTGSSDGATGRGDRPDQRRRAGLKPKDLVGIPWRVAFALQADGWYLRSDIIWSKPNPMPESVTDRPTKAHEYLFLLTRSPRYYFDAEAVREAPVSDSLDGRRGDGSESNRARISGGLSVGAATHMGVPEGGRNLRSVWNIATEPYPGAHFATFPRKLVEPCVKAGTSERGVCPECGAPWVRVVDRPEEPEGLRNRGNGAKLDYHTRQTGSGQKLQDWMDANPKATTGWSPTCGCMAPPDDPRYFDDFFLPDDHPRPEPVPAVVLDPFAGSGTTLLVAQALGRRGIGIDLSPDYLRQALERNRQTPLGLVG